MWSKRSQKRVLWSKPVGFALARWGRGAASLLPALVILGEAAASGQLMEEKSRGKRGWQLHKGVTCASASLVGAVKVSIDNTEYPQMAV